MENHIIRWPVTPAVMAAARAQADSMPSEYRYSILDGDGLLPGCVGEQIVKDYLGILDTPNVNTFDYDILYKGQQLELKTKTVTTIPNPMYEATVPGFNPRQKCNGYVFVRVLDNLRVGWILGYISKKEFMEKKRELKQHNVDGSNKFLVKASCYNVFIHELHPPENMLKWPDMVSV